MVNFWDLIFQVLFRMIYLATVVHEYGHLMALSVMGYRGVIRSELLNAVYPLDIALMSELEKKLFYVSGGLVQAATFLVLCIFDRDEEDRLVNKMVAVQGVVYAFFEGFFPRTWWEVGALVSSIASIIFMALVLVEKSNRDELPALPNPR